MAQIATVKLSRCAKGCDTHNTLSTILQSEDDFLAHVWKNLLILVEKQH